MEWITTYDAKNKIEIWIMKLTEQHIVSICPSLIEYLTIWAWKTTNQKVQVVLEKSIAIQISMHKIWINWNMKFLEIWFGIHEII